MIIDTELNNGTPICIRQVSEDDERLLREGIAQLSPRSRYLRFFSGMREPPQHVIDSLLDVDGYRHIAWGAIRTDLVKAPALGVVHAFREEEDPSTAEFSVAVVDAYHGLGLARILTAVLLFDCKREGLDTLGVHIIPDNDAALALTRSIGGKRTGRDRGVVDFEIAIDEALAALRRGTDVPGLARVFEQFDRPDRCAPGQTA